MPRSFAFAVALALAGLSLQPAAAQIAVTSDLYAQIKKADETLFNRGFNLCDMQAMEDISGPDLFFVHDQNGMSDRAAFLRGFKDSICANPNRKPIRKLVDGTMDVFPLYNEGKLYGAIQTATHAFYIKEPQKPLYETNVGRVTNLWLLSGGQWKLRESLSYDHRDPRPTDMFDAASPAPLFDNTARIEALLAQHNIPSMAMATIEGGRVQQVRAFGHLDDGTPAPLDTIYNVASLTKPVTALTTLKLVAAGQWDLDEPLAHYYVDPDIAGSRYLKYLTTRMVLTHRTGFPNWRYLTGDKKLKFQFRPGTRYQYSGEGFEYLRKALERKFGKGLNVLAREYVFAPLGMRDTHYVFGPDVDVARYASPHDANGKPIALAHHTQVNAAANLLTTAGDYAKLMAAILNGAGLPPKLNADMLTPQAKVKPNVEYGLGWGIYEHLGKANAVALQHTGGDDGIKAIAIMFPKGRRGLVVLSNSENGIALWKKIIEETYGDEGADLVALNLGRR